MGGKKPNNFLRLKRHPNVLKNNYYKHFRKISTETLVVQKVLIKLNSISL